MLTPTLFERMFPKVPVSDRSVAHWAQQDQTLLQEACDIIAAHEAPPALFGGGYRHLSLISRGRPLPLGFEVVEATLGAMDIAQRQALFFDHGYDPWLEQSADAWMRDQKGLVRRLEVWCVRLADDPELPGREIYRIGPGGNRYAVFLLYKSAAPVRLAGVHLTRATATARAKKLARRYGFVFAR